VSAPRKKPLSIADRIRLGRDVPSEDLKREQAILKSLQSPPAKQPDETPPENKKPKDKTFPTSKKEGKVLPSTQPNKPPQTKSDDSRKQPDNTPPEELISDISDISDKADSRYQVSGISDISDISLPDTRYQISGIEYTDTRYQLSRG
jgi:hypothetical protein